MEEVPYWQDLNNRRYIEVDAWLLDHPYREESETHFFLPDGESTWKMVEAGKMYSPQNDDAIIHPYYENLHDPVSIRLTRNNDDK